MSTDPNTRGNTPTGSAPRRFVPFVPEKTNLREMTLRAVILGLVMTVILGAANAYLGLKAGMTIAATYPAAIIGMAVLRLFKGSILEENIARTVGSIGESIAAGAIFTIPAFVMAGCWSDFSSPMAWAKSSALMIVGGFLGIFFVTLLRRVMVEDPDLPFPESTAASEIHKAGQRGLGAAMDLVWAMIVGGGVFLAGTAKIFTASRDFIIQVGALGKSALRLGVKAERHDPARRRRRDVPGADISPAYLGVGYIIGPELGAMNFAGGLLAWGLFVPLLMYLLGAANQLPRPPPTGSRSTMLSGPRRFSPSGSSLCVPSPWAECSSERRPRCTRCARTLPRAWAAPSRTSNPAPPPRQPPAVWTAT